MKGEKSTVQISEFNELSADEAAALIRPAADIAVWVDALVAARPYASVEQFLDSAADSALQWAASEVDEALADHPRIGERHQGGGASADFSAREQSSFGAAEDPIRQQLADGNAQYEKTFDRIFLIRAAGRGPEEILAELQRRLNNDKTTELSEVAAELRDIALLRLKGIFT